MSKRNKQTDQGLEIVIDLAIEYSFWEHYPMIMYIYFWRLPKRQREGGERPDWSCTEQRIWQHTSFSCQQINCKIEGRGVQKDELSVPDCVWTDGIFLYHLPRIGAYMTAYIILYASPIPHHPQAVWWETELNRPQKIQELTLVCQFSFIILFDSLRHFGGNYLVFLNWLIYYFNVLNLFKDLVLIFMVFY